MQTVMRLSMVQTHVVSTQLLRAGADAVTDTASYCRVPGHFTCEYVSLAPARPCTLIRDPRPEQAR